MITDKKIPKKEFSNDESLFAFYTQHLYRLIPEEEKVKVLGQPECELEPRFLGFVNVYGPLASLIATDKIVVDFGCYVAAQSYLFSAHKQYVGVDVIQLERFTPRNAVHYKTSIQEFIEAELPKLLEEHDINDFFAICSYVPDRGAVELVKKTFPNVCCYYPS